MIRLHDFADMATWPIKLIRPGSSGWTDSTLGTALGDDLLDVHINLKKLYEQNNKKALKYRIRITRFPVQPAITYLPKFAPVGWDGDPNNLFSNVNQSSLDGSFTLASITKIGNTAFFSVSIAPAGGTPVSSESGNFPMPPNVFTAATEIENTLINIEVAKLNYATFLDIDVVKRIDEPLPTNLDITVDRIGGTEGSGFSDGVIRPTDLSAPAREFFTETIGAVDIGLGDRFLSASAGLPYIKGSRVRVSSKADGSRFIEGEIKAYNTDDQDEFKNTRSQYAANVKCDGALGELVHSLTPGTLLTSAVRRAFASGDPFPNIRLHSEQMDKLDVFIKPSGLDTFDQPRIAEISYGPVVPGAPFWVVNESVSNWSNVGHVTAATQVYTSFHPIATVALTGWAAGYAEYHRSSTGIEELRLNSAGYEFQ